MTLFAEALPFAVVQTVPKGIVVVTTDTESSSRTRPLPRKTSVNPRASRTRMLEASVSSCSRCGR